MPYSKIRLPLLIAVAATLTLAACTHPRDSARRELTDIENELAAVEPEAQQHAPEQLAAAKESLANLKDAFDRKDYETISSNSPAVMAEVRSLADTIETKKQNLSNDDMREPGYP